MPLQAESLIKIYRGSRRLGTGRPVFVITSDTMNVNKPFAEYYIFHEFPDMPFIYSRANYAHADDMYLYDMSQYSGIFSAKALLESQFRAALDRLEHEVAIRERTLVSELFYSGNPLKFEETDVPMMEFGLFKRFVKERDVMFKFSKSQAIAALKEKVLELPEAIMTIEPKLDGK